jgi:hypothetical protein
MTSAYDRAVARSAGLPLATPTAISEVPANDNAVLGGSNGGPSLDDPALPPIIDPTEAFQKIDDLYSEARHWADGEPITTAEMAEAITALYDGLHAAGREAEDLRVKAKRPLDEAVDALQAVYNPFVQPKRGKVALGKDALGVLLTAWRTEQTRLATIAATKARLEAEALVAEAQAAMAASSGNLAERERAEEIVGFAKEATKFANRADKAATVNTGLRTVWTVAVNNFDELIDWAYNRDPKRFTDLAKQMADEAVRSGVRTIPGANVIEDKRAA